MSTKGGYLVAFVATVYLGYYMLWQPAFSDLFQIEGQTPADRMSSKDETSSTVNKATPETQQEQPCKVAAPS